ncbi:HTH-type transcriptional activator Btr [Mycobacteroides salmoniphilum]|uniref:HTH-type transcriptional activator Btr n=1 Tax=Mycobacteroides salmoniphilum TaxID=404941 RepID=A0A4R8RW69_9MYCO|nr:HTH-type transcriptional activator Btr [Mycobacteroides salmoniphilum]
MLGPAHKSTIREEQRVKFASDFSRLPTRTAGPNAGTKTGSRQLTVWDGTRPRTPRTWQSRASLTAGDAEYVFATEQVATPTDWFFHEPRHIIVVHRRGQLRTMEFEIKHGPSGRALPNIGDVWVIPAEHQYAALAHGDAVQYCQLSIPTKAIPSATVKPVVGQRDSLTHQLVERINGVKDRDDVFALLLIESLTESLLLHLADRHAGGGGTQPPYYRRLDKPTRAALIEYLDNSPDSHIGLTQLADCCRMTVREFTRSFAATFHTTPYQFFLSRRIAKAKRLLSQTALSIAEIGTAIGLSDSNHFAVTFEDHVGTSPSAYRDRT